MTDIASKRTPGPRRLTDAEVIAVGRDVRRLGDLYVLDALTVANVCDETLDRSGALLGQVREAVRQQGRSGGYPSPVKAANTYDELLAVAEAARTLVGSMRLIEGEHPIHHAKDCALCELNERLAALDAAIEREKEGHRER